MRLENMEFLIWSIENYLGPRVDYSMDFWPANRLDYLLAKALLDLKEEYYEVKHREHTKLKMFRKMFN